MDVIYIASESSDVVCTGSQHNPIVISEESDLTHVLPQVVQAESDRPQTYPEDVFYITDDSSWCGQFQLEKSLVSSPPECEEHEDEDDDKEHMKLQSQEPHESSDILSSPPQLPGPKRWYESDENETNTLTQLPKKLQVAEVAKRATVGSAPIRFVSAKNRKVTVKSMICNIQATTSDWSSLKTELEALGVKVTTDHRFELDLTVLLVVSLSRIVDDRYDEKYRMFVADTEHIEPEDLSIVVLEAKAMIDLLTGSRSALAGYFQKIADTVKTRILYIFQGLPGVVREHVKMHDKEIRQFAQRFVSGESAEKVPPRELPAFSVFSAAQTHLQVHLGLHLLNTSNNAETTKWIVNLIMDSSLARYSKKRLFVKRIQSSETDGECMVEALSQMRMVTPRHVKAIQQFYPTIAELIKALEEDGVNALSRPGLVGDVLAQSLAVFFTSTDPEELC